MKAHWQKLLFLLFVLGFALSAPLVVLYTAGFRYEFSGNRVVRTGVISVTTIPRGATLLIDGVEEPTRTPVVINNILPGAHEITLKKDGYMTWKKSLNIYSQSTTFAENIVLFFNDPLTFVASSTQPSTAESVQREETMFQGRRVKINAVPDRVVLSFLDEENVSTIIAYLPAGEYTFEPSPADVLFLTDRDRKRFIIVDPNNDQPILLNTVGTHATWQTKRSRLLFSDGFDVQTYDVPTQTRETLTRLSNPIVDLAWYPKGDVLFYATNVRVYALELDRRGGPNRYELGVLEKIESIEIDERGDLLRVVGTQGENTGTFQRRLQK